MKWLKRILVFLLIVGIGIAAYLLYRFRDRHFGYSVDLDVQNERLVPLQVGFSAVPITPIGYDSWTDANEDARYTPEDGDTFIDENGNGQFDPIYMAGFQNRRPAQGVHDQLWARAMVIDDRQTRLALVALDAIGFGNDDVIDVRKMLPEDLEIDYAILISTHTHEAPDLVGLWGPSEYKSGVDLAYMQYVKEQSVKAIRLALESTRPARLRLAQDLTGAENLVADTRKPIVLDAGIRLLQAVDAETGQTIGTLFNWANHPETLWNKNLQITSDFPHFVREALEKGVYQGDSLMVEGLGGTAIYVNGAIGGLMTTTPRDSIADPFTNEIYQEATFAKAKAQGDRLAMLGLAALRDSASVTMLEEGAIRLRAKTYKLPLDNKLYRLAAIVGVLDRGLAGCFKIRSEVSAWRIGSATFLHYPGELYPELRTGGVEAPEGQDFDLTPVETPIRTFMPEGYQFTVGLSNDMIGYIVPKSQWDEEPPFTYDNEDAPYGEINSVGTETAPILYDAMREVLEDLD